MGVIDIGRGPETSIRLGTRQNVMNPGPETNAIRVSPAATVRAVQNRVVPEAHPASRDKAVQILGIPLK